jgi:hypothetical protein
MDKPDPPPRPRARSPDFTPYIVLAVLLGVIALGMYAFPAIKGMMVYQDCVASGRVDCARR